METGNDNKYKVTFFIAAFRWLLLLLANITTGKSVEALAVKLTNDKQFFRHHDPVFVSITWPPLTDAHVSYVLGILQMLVVLMLVFRYFLCLIEPLTNRCVTVADDKKEQIDVMKLGEAWSWPLIMVVVVSAIEFILLTHAALAIASPRQWLTFLFWLGCFDLIAFCAVFPGIAWAHMICIKHVSTRIVAFQEGRKTWIQVLKSIQTPDPRSDVPGGPNGRRESEGRVSATREKLSQAKAVLPPKLYWKWDVADMIVALSGLCLIQVLQEESIAIVSVFLATSAVSWLNLVKNKRVYMNHIRVLTVKTSPYGQAARIE